MEAARLSAVVTADTSNLEAGLKRASGQVEGFAGGLTSRLASVGQGMAGALAVGAAAAGAGIAAGIGIGIKAAGDLQQAVANISTIKPEIDTSAVFGALNELQTRVPQSASQLGDSLYNVFSSIETTQAGALALVEKFAKGAVGAQTDAETFGTSVLGVMNAYGLAVEDADHISDVFFNTVNRGVITGQELASSLGPVTQSAKAAGVSLDELGGLIAGVTKEGGPAAQNVNNLNNFLQKVTTKEAVKEINALGVATTDKLGNFRPVTAILDDLKGRLEGMTEAGKANALQAIFPDAQARIGAQTLLSQLDFVRESVAANQEQAGSAASAFEKMNATFNSQVKILQNTLTSVLTTVGAELLPVVTPLITAFAAQLPAAFATARAAFASLSVAGTPLVQFFTDLWGTLQQVFAGEWSPDASINPVINALGTLAGIVQTVIIPNLLSLGTIVQKVMGGDFAGAVAEVGPILQRAGAAFGPILAGWAEQFGAWVGPATQSMLQQLVTLGAQGLAWVQSQLPGWTAQLLAWGQAFVAWVQPQIGPLLAQLQALASQALAWVASQVPTYTAALIAWGREFFAWVAPQIPPMLAELAALAKQVIAWLAEQVPTIVTKLAEWGLAFVKWVATEAIPKIVPELLAFERTVTSWIINQGAPAVGKTALEIGLAIVTGIIQGVANLQARLGAVVASAAIGALNDAKRALGIQSPSALAAQEVGVPIAEGVIAGFVQRMGGGSEMAEAVRAVVTTALKYGIDPAIALALAKAESNLNPRAIGDSGASVGLFQLHERGMGAGMGAGRFDPWANAERFLGDARVRELYERMFPVGQPITPEAVSRFGTAAEVSDPRYSGRYGQAYREVAAGGPPPTLSGQAAATAGGGEAMPDPTAWVRERFAAYKKLFEEMAPPAASATEVLTRLAGAAGQVQAQVANPAGGIKGGMEGMSAQLVTLGRNAGLGTRAFDEWTAGNISATSALDEMIVEAAKADPIFQGLADQVNSTGGSTDQTRLDFLNMLAAWKQTPAAAAVVTGATQTVGSTTTRTVGGMAEDWRTVSSMVDEARDRLRVYTDYLFKLTPQRLLEQSGGWRDIGSEVKEAARWVRDYSAAVTDIPPFPSSGADLEDIPEAHSGAHVRRGGLVNVAAGEDITTPGQRRGGGDTYVTYNQNLTINPRPGDEFRVVENFRILEALYGGH
jgi:TP901 family phage tail tape measure protein